MSLMIVYRGGTSGQFIRRLMFHVICEQYPDMQFCPYGGAHNPPDICTVNGVYFESDQSHYFSKIPEYIKKYRNVLTITTEPNNKREFIIRNINVFLKHKLYYNPMMPPSEVESPSLRENLNRYLGTKHKLLSEHIYNSRFDTKFKDICLYFSYMGFFNGGPDQYLHELEREWDGPVTSECIEVPFSSLVRGDPSALIDGISRIVGPSITNTQIEYAESMFIKYYNAQDKELYSDPYKFLENTRIRALAHLETLKQEYNQ